MRFGVIADNPVERIGLASGLIPTPMLEPYDAAFGRALMVATKVGVFERLPMDRWPRQPSRSDAGSRHGLPRSSSNLLVGMRYLRRPADGTYRLTRAARKWLLSGATASVRDMVLMKFLEWEWIEGLEDFVRTGAPLDVHGSMSADDWALYQRGMRAQAGILAGFLVRRLPMPPNATRDARHRRISWLPVGGRLSAGIPSCAPKSSICPRRSSRRRRSLRRRAWATASCTGRAMR